MIRKRILMLLILCSMAACSSFKEERHLFTANSAQINEGSIRLTLAGSTDESESAIVYGNPYRMNLLFIRNKEGEGPIVINGAFSLIDKSGMSAFREEFIVSVTGEEKYGQVTLMKKEVRLKYEKHIGIFEYQVKSDSGSVLGEGESRIQVSYNNEIYKGRPLP